MAPTDSPVRADHELLTLDEVADHLRVPVATVRWWRAQGKGPTFARIGRRLACRRSDLDRWLDDQFAERD
ncbi:helix-turn-helix domain-containing protein [Dermacoccus nishinomiyaensis]|uniref:helix-turn-helix domain-containing protein n=1 Tax=Dermacoccus nishinomiyaensis TaxID=1274 RepID=UPI00248E5EB0|nr:helix-turn-helix domain-containing protein [Dermacoccus nishinomiyaensis]